VDKGSQTNIATKLALVKVDLLESTSFPNLNLQMHSSSRRFVIVTCVCACVFSWFPALTSIQLIPKDK